MNVLSHVKLLVFICLIVRFAADGQAQDYPVRTIRFIVPFSAGGGGDITSRIFAGGLTQVLRQQVIVDNRPGAGANIGAAIAAKAPPDGYTLLYISNSHAANVSLYRNLAYDLVRDFAPVTQLVSTPFALVVHPSLPVKSIRDLVKLARAKAGALNFPSSGFGTNSFLAAELFKMQTGANMLHVPYKEVGMSVSSVISGETSVSFNPLSVVLPFIRNGRLRMLAVTSAKRAPMLPEYPTIAESGYPRYAYDAWSGLVMPVGAPREVIAKIRSAAILVLHDPNVRKALNDQGYVTVDDHQPEEFAARIKAEIETLGQIVRKLRATAD